MEHHAINGTKVQGAAHFVARNAAVGLSRKSTVCRGSQTTKNGVATKRSSETAIDASVAAKRVRDWFVNPFDQKNMEQTS